MTGRPSRSGSGRPSQLPAALNVRDVCGLTRIGENGFPEDSLLGDPLSPEDHELEGDQYVFGQPLTDHKIGETGHGIVDRQGAESLAEDHVGDARVDRADEMSRLVGKDPEIVPVRVDDLTHLLDICLET